MRGGRARAGSREGRTPVGLRRERAHERLRGGRTSAELRAGRTPEVASKYSKKLLKEKGCIETFNLFLLGCLPTNSHETSSNFEIV